MRAAELRKFHTKLIEKFQNSEELQILCEKYQENYSNLSKEHVAFLVNNINANIISSFKPLSCQTIERREEVARWLQRSCQEIPVHERKNAPWCVRQLFWLERKEAKIQDFFKEYGQLPEVNNPRDYIPLINDIKKERVDLITNYVLNSISYRDKHSLLEGEEILPSKKARISSKNASQLTWTQRVKD